MKRLTLLPAAALAALLTFSAHAQDPELPPGLRGPDLDAQTQELVDLFKAVADPTRLQLLGLLAVRERTVSELAETVGEILAGRHRLSERWLTPLAALAPDAQVRAAT